jgi:hypothetical protein
MSNLYTYGLARLHRTESGIAPPVLLDTNTWTDRDTNGDYLFGDKWLGRHRPGGPSSHNLIVLNHAAAQDDDFIIQLSEWELENGLLGREAISGTYTTAVILARLFCYYRTRSEAVRTWLEAMMTHLVLLSSTNGAQRVRRFRAMEGSHGLPDWERNREHTICWVGDRQNARATTSLNFLLDYYLSSNPKPNQLEDTLLLKSMLSLLPRQYPARRELMAEWRALLRNQVPKTTLWLALIEKHGLLPPYRMVIRRFADGSVEARSYIAQNGNKPAIVYHCLNPEGVQFMVYGGDMRQSGANQGLVVKDEGGSLYVANGPADKAKPFFIGLLTAAPILEIHLERGTAVRMDQAGWRRLIARFLRRLPWRG